MPLQCSTQWDGLGHIFDHGMAWNGRRAGRRRHQRGRPGHRHRDRRRTDRRRAACCSTSAGARSASDGELPDGFAITAEHLEAHHRRAGRLARSAAATSCCVRTGQLARARRDGWGDYAGGAAPGLSFTTAGWLHRTEIAAIATDTWGFEVRPNEFDDAFQPLHQVAIPHIGLFIGEMWDLDALAADCAADGVYEFLLDRRARSGHRRGRRARQPDRGEVDRAHRGFRRCGSRRARRRGR